MSWNTTAVIDLDCGQENNPDNGLDACDVRDDNGYDKPVAYTLTLGDEKIETDVVVVWRIVDGRVREVWDIPSAYTGARAEQ